MRQPRAPGAQRARINPRLSEDLAGLAGSDERTRRAFSALADARPGKAAVAVVTQEFEALAHTMVGKMLGQHEYAMVLPGGTPAERAVSARMAAELPHAMAAPAMSIGEVAALLSHASGVVGVDTGLTHLAVALGMPTVGIYCATQPDLTGLHGGDHAVNVGGRGAAPSVEAVGAAIGLGSQEE